MFVASRFRAIPIEIYLNQIKQPQKGKVLAFSKTEEESRMTACCALGKGSSALGCF